MTDAKKTMTNREMLLDIIDGDWLSNQFGNIIPLLEYDVEEGEANKPLTEKDIESFPIHDFEKLYGKGGAKYWYVEKRFSEQGKKSLNDLIDADTAEIFDFAKKIADEFRTYLAKAIELKTEKITALKDLAEIYNRWRKETTDKRGESSEGGEIKRASREWRR